VYRTQPFSVAPRTDTRVPSDMTVMTLPFGAVRQRRPSPLVPVTTIVPLVAVFLPVELSPPLGAFAGTM